MHRKRIELIDATQSKMPRQKAGFCAFHEAFSPAIDESREFSHTRKSVFGRFLPHAMGSFGSRLCENACAVFKSALLRKICQHLVNQQPGNLRRNAIFAYALTVKPALKRFHTVWARSSHSLPLKPDRSIWVSTRRQGDVCVRSRCYHRAHTNSRLSYPGISGGFHGWIWHG